MGKGDQSMPTLSGPLASTNDNQDSTPFGFEMQGQEQGDEFMAVKPWEGAVKPPSSYTKPKDQDKAPRISLTLEHCHGYRARDKRNNIFYVNNDDLCYYAAAVGIVHDVRSNTQRFFIRHRDDILSMSVHPNKKVVATAELGPKPMICIWSADQCTQICTVTSGIAKGVDNLCYSDSGKYLYASCMDDDHKVFIYDAENNYSLVATEKGGREFILGVTWISDTSFVTVGIKHYKHWTLSGSTLKGTKGAFKSKDDMLTCVAKTVNNDILCGSALGSLQIWQGSSNIDTKEGVHKKFLDAIAVGKQK
jgi:microtubule-associated protein-like 6